MTTRLQQWRERRFLSIRKLAEKAKVKPNTISDIERGKRKPRYDTAVKLADALGITLDDLADVSLFRNKPAA
jgi:transcriptional regulator with XRE-family HTH domain